MQQSIISYSHQSVQLFKSLTHTNESSTSICTSLVKLLSKVYRMLHLTGYKDIN